VRLHCRDGVAVLPGADSGYLEITRGSHDVRPDEAVTSRIDLPDEMPLYRELKVFVEHLSGGPPPRSSAADAAAVVRATARLRTLAGIGG
jgi:hypothetical protein